MSSYSGGASLGSIAKSIKDNFHKNTIARMDLFQNMKNMLFQIFPECVPISLTLDHIDRNGVKLTLSKPIMASITFSDDGYFCYNAELGITILSENIEDCEKDFEEEVLFLWNEYGKEDDSKLTEGAKKLKENILRHMRS
jgi:hypothetical protein